MLNEIMTNTMAYLSEFSKEDRKKYGQFFTGIHTAEYMASMFLLSQSDRVNILDAGCGNVMLAAALIERIVNQTDVKYICLCLYENDNRIFPLMEKNISIIRDFCDKNDISFAVKVERKNFITDNIQTWENDSYEGTFHYIISNPPYKKILKKSEESSAMKKVVYGQPNIYALFMAMSAKLLAAEGEMVFITPRSWTSGLYFKEVRSFLLSNCSLETVHLFKSRDKVFEKETILQEIMITKFKKERKQSETIQFCTSDDSSDYEKSTVITVRADNCIVKDGEKNYILLPCDMKDVELLSYMSRFDKSVNTLGFQFKTGAVVEFRNKSKLRYDNSESVIPLVQACNLSDGILRFGVDTDKAQYFESAGEKTQGFMKNSNTVFLKRFTTKEERRRLQPAVNLVAMHPEIKAFTTENHVNYLVKKNGEISPCEAVGFFILLSSDIWDTYYRMLNGSTQVNAEELNSMPVPELEMIRRIGYYAIKCEDYQKKFNEGELIRRFLA